MRTIPGPGSSSDPGGGETVQPHVEDDRPDGREPPGAGQPTAPRTGRGRRLEGDLLDRLAAASTFLTVAGVVAFVVAQLQPGLIFLPTMDVGGDTAAHVVAVYYFIHHLLPQLKLSGWDPQWFDGFPLYTFYFPLPAVLVALFSVFAPYAVAFKMVTALGSVTLPLAAYGFGRLAGLRRPLPALLCVATVPYLFNNAYTIDGGNVLSTMAGEFSFSLALTFAVLFLGVFIRSLRTGRLRWLAALLFVLTVLSHLVPALFAAGVAVLFTLANPDPAPRPSAWPDARPGALVTLSFLSRRFASWSWNAYRRPMRVLLGVGIAGGLLSAFWLVPFYVFGLRDGLTSSMNYGRVPGSLWANLFPLNGELAVLILALIGALVGIGRADRLVTALAVTAIGSAALFQLAPSGLVYNGRWIPFWYLSTAFLAAFGTRDVLHGLVVATRVVGVLASTIDARAGLLEPEMAATFARDRAGNSALIARYEQVAMPVATGALVVLLFSAWLGVLPMFNLSQRNFANNWTNFNYAGYQRKPGWPEFQRVIAMLDRVGATSGCGRLDYEYSKNTSNLFGSTLVPMSFPLWTNGCIDSAEGVYFESSTTTDFHFLDQAELSMDASNPVGGLPYQNLSIPDGIRHLQLEGVRYFLANSPTVEQQASLDPSLVELASTPASVDSVDTTTSPPSPAPPGGFRWVVYEIKGSELVTPLHYEPVVEAGISKRQWRSTAITWYQNEQYWPVPIARDGPAAWRRVAAGDLVAPGRGVPVPATTVSRITSSDSSISFDVSRTATPVLVKIPYFPNWQASGAAGPFEVTPNLMVVVPSAHHVVLRYGTSGTEWLGRGGTLAGVAVLGLLAFTRPVPPAPAPGPRPTGRRATSEPLDDDAPDRPFEREDIVDDDARDPDDTTGPEPDAPARAEGR